MLQYDRRTRAVFWENRKLIAISMTAVIIFVIPLIIFKYGSIQFLFIANKLDFYGSTHIRDLHELHTNLFATNMNCRLPILKIISGMTNLITAVMLIAISMPRAASSCVYFYGGTFFTYHPSATGKHLII